MNRFARGGPTHKPKAGVPEDLSQTNFGLAKIKTFARHRVGIARPKSMHVYGYARVSTGGQELDLQLAQLRAAGCTAFYCEKESGIHDRRRELSRLLRTLKPGDVVVITALDRLTRGGPFKMLSVLQEITKRGATYKSLAEPWADTTHELGEVLAALVGYIARKTREDILRRTAEGRARAQCNGVKFGRRPKLSASQRREAAARHHAGETWAKLAAYFHVSISTVTRSALACRCPESPPHER